MDLLTYLKSEPRARERRFKNRAIGNIVCKKYPYLFGEPLHRAVIADMIGEVLTLDRKWRLILKENPELRGTDYGKKDELEEDKLVELGYLDKITP